VMNNLRNQIWIEPELLADVGCELPQIDYFNYMGKFYRYFYAINTDIDYEHCGAVRKIDTLTKTHKLWYDENCYTSEPIFLPRPNAKHEDDGVIIISLLRSGIENEVSLVILDAMQMTEIGRVKFCTNGPVPKCLHGWYDAAA
ncbi:unnamed protein product, partial [Didymodactylos carnosus]